MENMWCCIAVKYTRHLKDHDLLLSQKKSSEKIYKKPRGCRCLVEVQLSTVSLKKMLTEEKNPTNVGWMEALIYSERPVQYCKHIRVTPTFYFIKSINHSTGCVFQNSDK
ncbi:hypothetical protein CEXT_460791 [Caerostris extrusa]|uniref:Uncharacterized protein n=1 Tax=Caerostris extrusa TaxID=172846 RepID=A0AAV4TP67_CAEEX|nr:hypothetical protein CEXT_460791 [Caerostris extrusa]